MRIREAAPVTSLPGSGLTTAPAGEGPEPVDRYSPAADPTGANLIPRPPAFAERVERIRPPEVPGQPRRVTPTYQQTSPAWVDPEGDAHLIRLTQIVAVVAYALVLLDFLVRTALARKELREFLRRNWFELVGLLLPFLRPFVIIIYLSPSPWASCWAASRSSGPPRPWWSPSSASS